MADAIVRSVPNAIVMKNMIPKAYLDFDLYCNLIPDNDPNLTYFQQVPRTGAFEVSYKGLVSRNMVYLLVNFQQTSERLLA